jgi:RNA polymerase sigma factor (sigma-70 family)
VSDDATTQLIRKAKSGDPPSVARLVERFSPWLTVQARLRLGDRLRSLYDPEDLVHDVWLAALPRLVDLRVHRGRHTPAVVRYLSQTLLYRLQDLLEKHIAGKPLRRPAHAGDDESAMRARSLTDAFSHAVLRERQELLWREIEGLEARDRQLILLRAIERHPVAEIALILGMTPNAVSVAYRRAFDKLRSRLAGSLIDDLGES